MRRLWILLSIAVVPALSGCDTSSWTEPVTVQAIGRDFEWWFRYPGADGTLGTEDDVEEHKLLVLPPHVDAKLLLTSDDYVYMITLPGYAPRQIAVPEMTHEIDFQTASDAQFELLVDPLCAFRFVHDEVMGRVRIESRRDFAHWYGRG